MQLKTTKAIIELLKEFNRYYFIKHKRLTNSAVNRTDNLYSLDANYWSKDKLADYIAEGKLYELLKTEFKDNILYIDNKLTYRYLSNNSITTIEIFYPFNGNMASAGFTVENLCENVYFNKRVDNITNLNDIIDIIGYLKGKLYEIKNYKSRNRRFKAIQ